jgi:LysM repeat protein
VIATTSPSPVPTPRPTPSVIASVEPSGSPAPSARTYKVKKGDTLLGIAKTFGTTAAKIRALNGLKSSSLKVGQVLKIP